MWAQIREEFKLVKFRLLHNNGGDFAESQWFPAYVCLIYRFVLAAYCLGWIIFSGSWIPYPLSGKWFLYLTNWQYALVTAYFISATLVSLRYLWEERKQGEYDMRTEEIQLKSHRSSNAVLMEKEKSRVNPLDLKETIPMKWYHEALWVIYNIAANNSLLVTIAYWSAVYQGNSGPDGLDISTHLLNCIFMLIETFLSAVPVRVLHFIYGFLFFVAYVIVVVFYWGFNPNKPLYAVLDFSKSPGLAAGLVILYILVAQPLAQLLYFGLYNLRVFIKTRCFTKEKDNVTALAGSQHITFG